MSLFEYKNSTPSPHDNEAIIIVDPFSTGAHIPSILFNQFGDKYKCISLLSAKNSPVASLVQKGIDCSFCVTVIHDDEHNNSTLALELTIQQLRSLPYAIVAILPGAETGVELSDQVAEILRLRSNGLLLSVARRNKFLMGETIRNAGIRAVKQEKINNLTDLRQFLSTFPQNSFKCVLKPVQSAGTDCVFLCETIIEAEEAFDRIYGKKNGLGLFNDSVLIQEYLQGKEYVVDQVSRDGKHKLVAVWEYDKRQVNGANFVYFGNKILPSSHSAIAQLLPYANQVLDALQISQGASHMEIIMTRTSSVNDTYEPCLVEVGSRCQGGEGTWLRIVDECIGYSQVSVTLNAYLCEENFNSTPDVYTLLKNGRDVDLVSRCAGMIRSIPGHDIIKSLPSFRSVNWDVQVNEYCPITIDCFTRPGCVQLVADNEEDIERDIAIIRSLELEGLFQFYDDKDKQLTSSFEHPSNHVNTNTLPCK
eukprot:gene16136-21931_t